MFSTIIKFPQLLAPIEADNPAGFDLRLGENRGKNYQKLKELCFSARAIERQIRQGDKPDVYPDWEQIQNLAEKILITESKDLEVAAWLIEALVRRYKFAGLSDGFQLTRQLIEMYGDVIYPLPDDDGELTRLAPLIGLNGEETDGTLIIPIALIPLTEGDSVGPFALWEYQQAIEHLKVNYQGRKKINEEKTYAISLEKIMVAVSETSVDFFCNLLSEINVAIDEFKKLTITLKQKYLVDFLPSSRILGQMNACLDCLNNIASEKISTIKQKPVKTAEINYCIEKNKDDKPCIIEEAYTKNYSKISPNVNRETILQLLLDAADYFRHAEPHSPISYMIERVVKWGKLSLPELLREIIKDKQTWEDICNLIGVNNSSYS